VKPQNVAFLWVNINPSAMIISDEYLIIEFLPL
jgi:hypothetical protein